MKLVLIIAMMFLGACANRSAEPLVLRVAHYEELPQCNPDLQGVRAIVEDINKKFYCSDGQWLNLISMRDL